MTLFKDDPEIEQWFRDLFADLVESFPGVTKTKSRLPKYWHSLHGFKPQALEKAFLRATEICEYFPSVPKILEIQSQGFGSQPYSKPGIKDYDDGRGVYPPYDSQAHQISRQVTISILRAMRDGIERSKDRERIWAENKAFWAEKRVEYQEAMVNINPDTGKEFTDEVPF